MDTVSDRGPQSAADVPTQAKQRWVEPRIADLPRLTELTLQTGNPIVGGGGTSGGGSTVF